MVQKEDTKQYTEEYIQNHWHKIKAGSETLRNLMLLQDHRGIFDNDFWAKALKEREKQSHADICKKSHVVTHMPKVCCVSRRRKLVCFRQLSKASGKQDIRDNADRVQCICRLWFHCCEKESFWLPWKSLQREKMETGRAVQKLLHSQAVRTAA